MSVGTPDEYKRTIFDKRGPEAAHFLQSLSSLIIPIVAGAFIGAGFAVQKGWQSPYSFCRRSRGMSFSRSRGGRSYQDSRTAREECRRSSAERSGAMSASIRTKMRW